jgi:drug/metabolite transporter (DMT)-like permease
MTRVLALRLSQFPSRGIVTLILLLGSLAGSWAFIFGRMAQDEHIPTASIIAFRMVLGTLILTPFVLRRHSAELRRLSGRDLLFVASAGFWLAMHLILGFASLEHTSVLVSTILVGTSPLWIALAEATLLHTRLGQVVWVGLFLTLGGSVVIALSSGSNIALGSNPGLGVVLAISASLTGAAYGISGRSSRKKMSFLPYLWLIFLLGSIVCVIIVIIGQTPMIGFSAKGYFALIMLTLFPQIIGHVAYNYALRHLPATYCSVVGQVGMIEASVLAVLLFHEIPSALMIPGSIAVIAGITLVNLGKMRGD